MLFRRGGIDGEVLEELRAIRAELHEVMQQVGKAATREELDDYVTKETFNSYLATRARWADVARGWFPNIIAAVALAYAVFGPHLPLK